MYRLGMVCLMASSLMVSGCVPLLVGGAAMAGYMGSQDIGAIDAVEDLKIKTHIKDNLTAQNYKYLTQVEVSVIDQNVLLTGVVETSRNASEVEAIVRGTPGVDDVYNELFTDGIYPPAQYTKDTWLVTQIKSLMFKDEQIKSVNYQVQSVNNHVYVYGIAGSHAEMERVRHLARTTKGVSQVHSFIKVRKLFKSDSKAVYHAPSVESEGYLSE